MSKKTSKKPSYSYNSSYGKKTEEVDNRVRIGKLRLSKKAFTISISVLAFLLVAAIVLTIVLTSLKPNDNPTNSPKPTPSATTLPITNSYFDDVIIDSPIAEYPLTPKAWSFVTSSEGVIVDEDYVDSIGFSKYGIINTEADTYNSKIKPLLNDLENPLTPFENGYDAEKNILMIYNKHEAGVQYSSQYFTIDGGKYARIDIWVKTSDVYLGDGADIKVSDNSAANLEFISINTHGVTDNNGWVRYSFYISTNTNASKSFSITLSFGGTKRGQETHNVAGYAFFDAIDLTYVSKAEYKRAKNSVEQGDAYTKYYEYKPEVTPVSSNLLTNPDFATNLTGWTGDYGSGAIKNGSSSSVVEVGVDFPSYLTDVPFEANNALLIHNTASTSYGYRSSTFIVPANKYYKISIWVKTSELAPNTGAYVYLINENDMSKSVFFGNIDTTNMTTEDYNTGWVELVFYIQGSNTYSFQFHLELFLGRRDNIAASQYNTAQGHAFFADIDTIAITQNEYDNGFGDNTKKVSLRDTRSSNVSNGLFNNSTNNDSSNYPTTPSDWSIYYSGHKNLPGIDNSVDTDVPPVAYNDAICGIINTDHMKLGANSSYYYNRFGLSSQAIVDLANYADPITTGPNVLMIYNVAKTGLGYISKGIALNAESYYRISLKVKTKDIVSNGGELAGVNIYLQLWNDDELDITNQFNGINTQTIDLASLYANDIFDVISTLDNDYIEFSFVIALGEVDREAKLELWLGSREYSADNLTSGYAFFDYVKLTSMTEDEYKEIIEKIGDSSYANLIMLDYTDEKAPEKEDHDHDEEEDKNNFQWDWLMFSSILLSVVLIGTIITVLIRRIIKRYKSGEKPRASSDYKRRIDRSKVRDDEQLDEHDQEQQVTEKPAKADDEL